MADGGAITLRLSLQGADQVRAELAKTGPAGAAMAREIDRAMRQPTAGMKALDTGAKEARRSIEGLAAGAGGAGSVLQSFGGWGLAAAAALAAVIAVAAKALQLSNEATTTAAAITDAADRIGVGTEALQQWRFVADEAGVPVQALEADLEKLNGVLGKFKMGIGDAKLKPWFEELGIKKSDLDSIQTADQLFMLLADRLGQVQDRSKQVAGARAFGIEASLPILRLGTDRIEELLDASRRLGTVMDAELVAKLDAADRKAELAGQQLKVLAFGAVEPLATALANLGAWIGNASVEFDRAIAKAPGWASTLMTIAKMMPGTGVFAQGFELAAGRMMQGRQGSGGPAANQDAGAAIVPGSLQGMMENFAQGGPGGGFDWQGHSTRSGGGGVDKEAQERERKRREAERAVERLDREGIQAQRDWFNAVIAGKDTADARAEAARVMLSLDQQEEAAELDKMRKAIEAGGLMTAEVQARLEKIDLLRQDVAAARTAQIEERRIREQREAVRAAEQAHADVTAEILSIASSVARTSDERRAIELQLLEIAQRRQRADLEAAIEAEKEPAARARLVDLLNRLPKLFEAQVAAVNRENAGPTAKWWDDQKSVGQAQEWIQGEALDALDGLNRGLIDATKNVDSASDAFTAMGEAALNALQKVADGLMEIALQRLLIQPLASALFGDSSGSGGLLSGLLNGAVGAMFGGGLSPKAAGGSVTVTGGKGFAGGGVAGATGLYPVGERGLELAELPAGTRIYDTDRSERILRDAMRGGGQPQVVAPTINMPVKVINTGSEQMTATTRQTPDGIEVILAPLIRGEVNRMGADGGLARAGRLQRPPKRR